jgi:hypothetical protein
MLTPQCGNCRFAFLEYEVLSNQPTERARCYRYPPVPVRERGEIVFAVPTVAVESWCGEWDLGEHKIEDLKIVSE